MSEAKSTTHPDISGQTFNYLTAIRKTNHESSAGKRLWECRCICGATYYTSVYKLRSGSIKSCGCMRHKYSHGLSATRARSAHSGMMRRCYDPKAKNFHHYGGRGIRVCERWQDISSFYADMDEPPARLTVERVDNNGNYSCGKCSECFRRGWPLNVRWASYKEQLRNRRNNHILTAFGKTACLGEWVELSGFCANTITARMRAGLSPEESLTKPSKKGTRTLLTEEAILAFRLNVGSRPPVMDTPPGGN